jgi:hypothetical protein
VLAGNTLVAGSPRVGYPRWNVRNSRGTTRWVGTSDVMLGSGVQFPASRSYDFPADQRPRRDSVRVVGRPVWGTCAGKASTALGAPTLRI